MAISKERIRRMNSSGSYDIIHHETDSDVVIINTNTSGVSSNSLTKAIADIKTTNTTHSNDISALKNTVGTTPTVVSSNNDMTDHNKIYVLTTDGNWYYWNGSSFVSGGSYTGAAVATDKTLTTENRAADGKATGNMIIVNDTQPSASITSNKLWIKDNPEDEYSVPTYEEFEDLNEALSDAGNVSYSDALYTYGTFKLSNTAFSASANVQKICNFELKGGTKYTFEFEMSEAQSSYVYLYLKDDSGNNIEGGSIGGIATGSTTATVTKKIANNYANARLMFLCSNKAITFSSVVVSIDGGEMKTVKGDIADDRENLHIVNDEVFNKTEKSSYESPTGYRLNEYDGLCSANADYKLEKFTVTAGDRIEVISDDRFQFQNASSVPSSGTSNRVGKTYGAGEYVLTVPTGAYYLILSTPVSGSVAKCYSISSMLEVRLQQINYASENDSTLEHYIRQNRLRGTVYGPADKLYVAKTTTENWQAQSYLTYDNIPVSPTDIVLAVCSSRHGLGLRSGRIGFYDSNGDSVLSISLPISGDDVNPDGGFCKYAVTPYGAVKAKVQFEGISNATSAGESSVVGEEYFVKGCYAYVGARRSSFLDDEWTEAVDEYRAKQGSGLCFGVQTDTHFALLSEELGENLKELSNWIGFDFIANLGDITRGYKGGSYEVDSNENMRKYAKEIMRRYTDNVGCPFLYCFGNHEKNTSYADEHSIDPFSYGELYGQYFKQVFNTCAAVADAGKMYYYVDTIPARIIVLNTNEGTNSAFGVSNGQQTWFASKALDTDKPVLVLSHVPLIQGISENYDSSYSAIVSSLQSFRNGGGEVIGCVCGHTHSQSAKCANGIWYIVCTTSHDLVQDGQAANHRSVNTAELFMCDSAASVIKTIGLGNAVSRIFHTADVSVSTTETLTTELSGTITWGSANSSVATVSNGVVTAVASGSSVITAVDESGNIEAWNVVVS